ncbi:MAG: hypothetical protein COA42_19750 [Alteromonadaceae bacterium]|nr:MAG: hypothetical protein COA42_19750 [Alteromonadaceae bacterium]
MLLLVRSWSRFTVTLLGSCMLFACGASTPVKPTNTFDYYQQSQQFQANFIAVNQLGYPVKGKKIASMSSNSKKPLTWSLVDLATTKVVLEGQTRMLGYDEAAGGFVHRIDFSDFRKKGRYTIRASLSASWGFNIADDLYQDLPKDAMGYFYFHRMGEAIEAKYLDDPRHARGVMHATDDSLPCYKDWCGEGVRLNLKGSWADAGDFGFYLVNHAISVWTLLNAYEFNPASKKDGDYRMPENNNGLPDLLDEVRAGTGFLAGSLPPGGQLAPHKVTNEDWSSFLFDLDTENAMERYVQPPSTAATYAVVRMSAQLARTFNQYDSTYAKAQWRLALEAWRRAEAKPEVLYRSDTPDSPGAGDYPDNNVSDDRYAAAVELLVSAKRMGMSAGEMNAIRDAVTGSDDYLNFDRFGSQNWNETQGAGSLSLWLHWDGLGLPAEDKERLDANIIESAEYYLTSLEDSAYPTVYNPLLKDKSARWEWGSNSFLANNMIMLAYAHRVSGEKKYLEGLYWAWDFLLGNNPMNLSFITGYGTYAETDTHDRIAFTKLLGEKVPYPKGWLSGGPMNDANSCAGEPSTNVFIPAALAYAGVGEAPSSWCSKENTINWNSPLYWLAAFTVDNPLE